MPAHEAITGPRIDWKSFQQLVPEVAAGMAAIGPAFVRAGLDPALLELLKIRVSQINGCAFCIQHHLNDARKLGVAPAKLDLIAAWREAGIYSPRECAAFAWAEAVTRLAQHPITDEAWARIAAEFSQHEVAALTTAIAQINLWNRLAVPFRFTPPIPSAATL